MSGRLVGAQWRDELGLTEPFVLVGHSMGAILAVEYALRNPGHLSALVLASPCGGG